MGDKLARFWAKLTEQRSRAYLYRVVTAAAPVLTIYGVLSDAKAAIWVGLAAAVLGTGTAMANTSTKS